MRGWFSYFSWQRLTVYGLVFLLLPFLLTLPCYQQHYASTDQSRHLVVKKDGRIVGYIKGSAHLGLTQAELSKDKQFFQEIIPQSTHVFFEANVGHWSGLAVGLERIALEVLEPVSDRVKAVYMESIDAQRAMLGSIYFYGDETYYIPYGNLYDTWSTTAGFVNAGVSIALWPGTLVYQKLLSTGFADRVNDKNVTQMQAFRRDYLRGRTGVMDSKMIESFRIVQRDQRMYARIQQVLADDADHGQFIVIIGMMHLAANDGLLSHFKADGYVIESM